MPSTQLLKPMMMKMTSDCHLMGCEVYLLFVISLDSCFLCYNSKMDFVFIFLSIWYFGCLRYLLEMQLEFLLVLLSKSLFN